jgi:hypothetical protein
MYKKEGKNKDLKRLKEFPFIEIILLVLVILSCLLKR